MKKPPERVERAIEWDRLEALRLAVQSQQNRDGSAADNTVKIAGEYLKFLREDEPKS